MTTYQFRITRHARTQIGGILRTSAAIGLAFGSGFGFNHLLVADRSDAARHGACIALDTASAYGFLDSEGRRRTLHLLAHEYQAMQITSPTTFEGISTVCASLTSAE
jgi:hypothetical protein